MAKKADPFYVANGARNSDQNDFDPRDPPLFRIADIRAAISSHCLDQESIGHGSFSNSRKLDSIVVLHSSILVPYHGWRISHRIPHQNHGHVENDEFWVPLTQKIYKNLDSLSRILRFKIPFPIFAYPFYLWSRSPGKEGAHFPSLKQLVLP